MSSRDAIKTSSIWPSLGLGSTIALCDRASETLTVEFPNFKFKRPYLGRSRKSVPKGTPIKMDMSGMS